MLEMLHLRNATVPCKKLRPKYRLLIIRPSAAQRESESLSQICLPMLVTLAKELRGTLRIFCEARRKALSGQYNIEGRCSLNSLGGPGQAHWALAPVVIWAKTFFTGVGENLIWRRYLNGWAVEKSRSRRRERFKEGGPT